MKHVFTTLILICGLSTAAFCQLATFSVTPNPVEIIAPHDEPDVEGDAIFTNLENVTKSIKWERFLIYLTPGCQTQVCDPNACYAANIGSHTFEIAPNASFPLIVHFLNPDSILGANAIVHIKLTNLANPADTLTAVYLFTAEATGTGEPLPQVLVQLFPNPATQYFTLSHASAVKSVRMYSLDGRQVAYFSATPDQTYHLNSQPAGNYVLALEDAQGRTFQALELHVR